MSIIAFIFSAIGALALLVGLLGLVWPQLFKDRKTGRVMRRGDFAKSAAAGLVFFGIGSFISPADEAETPAATVASGAAAADISERGRNLAATGSLKELPLSFDELRDRINNQMALFDTPKTRPIPQHAKPGGDAGAVNFTYRHEAAENLHILISANPANARPRGITILSTLGGGTVDAIGLFAKATAILAAPAADGSAKSKELAGKLFKMAGAVAKEFADKPEEQVEDSFTENGITYGISFSPGMPMMMYAEPAK